jgi:hypothetical protein
VAHRLPSQVSVLSAVGGALWLAGYALLLTAPGALPLGHVSVAAVAMACGALLIGAAVGLMLVTEAPARLRALGLTLLVASGAVMLFGLAGVALIGDEDVIWGFIDPELTAWWGLTAFMASIAVATSVVRLVRRQVTLAWVAAVLGAAGQALAYALAIIGVPPALIAVPAVVFGVAWIAIGFGLSPLARTAHARPLAPLR